MQNEPITSINNYQANQQDQQIFKPGSWLSKIEYINQHIVFNNLIFAVLAAPASGKTTFINLLQAGLDAAIQSYVIKAPYSASEFLDQLCLVANLSKDTNFNLSSIVAYFNEKKIHTLIIIDDAQHLPESFLDEVELELKNQEQTFLHLCLVADFSLSETLNKLDKGLIQYLELGNLTLIETKTYLRTILPKSKKLEKALREKNLGQLYESTKGNIACINEQVPGYVSRYTKQADEQRNYLFRGLSYSTLAALALVASSYLWQNRFLPSSEDFEDNYETSQVFAEALQPLPSLVPDIPLEEMVLISQLVDIKQELVSQGSLIPSYYLAAISQQTQPTPRRIVNVQLDDETDDSLVVRDRVVVIPKTLNVRPVKIVPSQTIVAATSKKSTAKAKIQPYTIQIMASFKQQDLLRFVNKHKIKNNFKIRLTQRDNADWYLLTLGEYTQKEQARTAIKNLPYELISFHPWVRPVAGLKGLG